MLRLLAYLALAAALAAAVLNGLTFFGVTLVGETALRVLTGIAVAAMLAHVIGWWKDRRSGKPRGWYPNWMAAVCAATALYAGGTYVADRILDGTGTIERAGNRPVLLRNGRILRALDPEGVRAVEVWHVRARTAYVLPFLLLPSLALLFPERVGREPLLRRVKIKPSLRKELRPAPDEPSGPGP